MFDLPRSTFNRDQLAEASGKTSVSQSLEAQGFKGISGSFSWYLFSLEQPSLRLSSPGTSAIVSLLFPSSCHFVTLTINNNDVAGCLDPFTVFGFFDVVGWPRNLFESRIEYFNAIDTINLKSFVFVRFMFLLAFE